MKKRLALTASFMLFSSTATAMTSQQLNNIPFYDVTFNPTAAEEKTILTATKQVDKLDPLIVESLYRSGIRATFFKGKLTDVPALQYLKKETYDKMANVGKSGSYDALVGYQQGGTSDVFVKVDYKEPDFIYLHELGHSFMYKVLGAAVNRHRWTTFAQTEGKAWFTNQYYHFYDEYFAEIFARYHYSAQTKQQLKEKAPQSYNELSRLINVQKQRMKLDTPILPQLKIGQTVISGLSSPYATVKLVLNNNVQQTVATKDGVFTFKAIRPLIASDRIKIDTSSQFTPSVTSTGVVVQPLLFGNKGLLRMSDGSNSAKLNPLRLTMAKLNASWLQKLAKRNFKVTGFKGKLTSLPEFKSSGPAYDNYRFYHYFGGKRNELILKVDDNMACQLLMEELGRQLFLYEAKQVYVEAKWTTLWRTEGKYANVTTAQHYAKQTFASYIADAEQLKREAPQSYNEMKKIVAKMN